MLRYDWLVCVWGAGLSKGPFIPKQSVSFVLLTHFCGFHTLPTYCTKSYSNQCKWYCNFSSKSRSQTNKQIQEFMFVWKMHLFHIHVLAAYLIIRWRCAENLSCSWFCGIFSVASGKLGALRLKVRLVEDRILPSVYYQPLIHLLVESVISPTEVSFTICPKPQPHQHLSWFIKSINQ